MPNETLRSCGFSADYFPQFRGIRSSTARPLALPLPRKNPNAAPCDLSRKTGCHHSAAGWSQRYGKPLKCANMTCKSLSLIEIMPKNPVCCLRFAAAFPPFGRNRVSENVRSARMRLKRFDFNAILCASLRSRCDKSTPQKQIQ
jgi:hypothetical protein